MSTSEWYKAKEGQVQHLIYLNSKAKELETLLKKGKGCITCSINLNGLSIAKVSNLGKPKWTDIEKVFGSRIERDSVFVTDSFRGYDCLSYEMELNYIRIPRNKHKNGVFNIHQLLNNYLIYHNLVNFAKGSMEYKENVMRDFVLTTGCIAKNHDISQQQAIPI